MNGKISNRDQVISAYELTFDQGIACGKKVILVHNGGLELMISKTNALDILYLKYNGKNVSFLSKNGINENKGDFLNCFEGGFLYTCGMDAFSTCVPNKPMHGSLHKTNADNVNINIDDDKVVITGVVKETALFGKNLKLYRKFTITENSVLINDVMVNEAFTDGDYAMLYHVNFGYPFLDESLEIKMNLIDCEGCSDYAEQHKSEHLNITESVDGGLEQCFYCYSNDGKISLVNPEVNIRCEMNYDMDTLPYLVEWKSMVSGDYALGIEPCTTRFKDFKLTPIKAGEKKEFNVSLKFNDVK